MGYRLILEGDGVGRFGCAATGIYLYRVAGGRYVIKRATLAA